MKLTSQKYLFTSYLVSDVRAITKQCSLAFQDDGLNLNSFNESLDGVDEKLAQLKTTDGPMLSAFKSETNDVAGSFNGIETNDDEVPSSTLRPVLCDRVRSAVRESFKPIRDNESLKAAQVFRHEEILLLQTELEVLEYGNASVKLLTKKFAVSLQIMGAHTGEIIDQWKRFKKFIRQKEGLAAKSYDQMWDWMNNFKSSTLDPTHMYDLLCVVALVRNFLLDTSCCERGFSVMNLLRTAVRNRLSERLCRVLMTIVLIGGEDYKHPDTVPVDEIYQIWKAEKKRYSVATDEELWGQKQWDDLLDRLRELRGMGDVDGYTQ